MTNSSTLHFTYCQSFHADDRKCTPCDKMEPHSCAFKDSERRAFIKQQEQKPLDNKLADLGAWITQEIAITENQLKHFTEQKNREMKARCDSSIRTLQKILHRINNH